MKILQELRLTSRNHTCIALGSLVLCLSNSNVAALGTAFTYQGRLDVSGSAANGVYDLTFSVWVKPVGPGQVGSTVTNSPVTISNSTFTVILDFGAEVFNGSDRWLEIGVRTNGGGRFTILAPRQSLTPVPYAIFAGTASAVPGNSIGPAEIVTGGVRSEDILDNTITSADLANGTITVGDLDLASVDSRYVLKAGDTMTGPLTTPLLTASSGLTSSLFTNISGILSLSEARR